MTVLQARYLFSMISMKLHKNATFRVALYIYYLNVGFAFFLQQLRIQRDSISSCNSQMTILQYLHKANQRVPVNTWASLILCIFSLCGTSRWQEGFLW